MYQRELFEGLAVRHGRHLGRGLFSQVWRMTDGTVCKIGKNDGTRNWLELCALHTEAGTLMTYMPEVFAVVPLNGGKYMALMPEYGCLKNSFNWEEMCALRDSVMSSDAGLAYMDYLTMLKGREVRIHCVFNDIHSGNVMSCPRRGTIVTDPNAGDYIQQEHTDFVLH